MQPIQTTKPVITLALTLALAAAFGGFWVGRNQGQEQARQQVYELAKEANPLWRFGGHQAPTKDSQTLKLRVAQGNIRAALTLSDRYLIQASNTSGKGSHDDHEIKLLLEAFQAQDQAYSILYQNILRLASPDHKPWPIF
ncbi:MAG: hypothetical protein HKL99_00705 [Burkholderiales bacterium]|nr:hypothetical protein [Burkholderiales bacterium]